LDFSKIESGRLQLECAPVDLRGVVEKIVGLLAVQNAFGETPGKSTTA